MKAGKNKMWEGKLTLWHEEGQRLFIRLADILDIN